LVVFNSKFKLEFNWMSSKKIANFFLFIHPSFISLLAHQAFQPAAESPLPLPVLHYLVLAAAAFGPAHITSNQPQDVSHLFFQRKPSA
jgi:hypothetical protein